MRRRVEKITCRRQKKIAKIKSRAQQSSEIEKDFERSQDPFEDNMDGSNFPVHVDDDIR